MFYYIDLNNNLIKSTRALSSPKLRPITKEEYEAELQIRMEVEE
jgi:hypothetical protein